MKRKFAIGDIHGCAKTFAALLKKLQLTTADELYLLGDYFDRGPDTKGVLDKILQLKKDGYSLHCLGGNHEELFLNAFVDYDNLSHWLGNGGWKAMQSFGTFEISEIPQKYIDFVQSLEYYFLVDDYILVHAGLNFRRENPLEDNASLLWIRDWYENIDYEWLGKRIIIHGHTPIERAEIDKQFESMAISQFLNIDNGCVFGTSHPQKPGLGNLVAFNLTERKLIFQEKID